MKKVTMAQLEQMQDRLVSVFLKNGGSVFVKITFKNEQDAWGFHIDKKREDRNAQLAWAGKAVIIGYGTEYDYTPYTIYYNLQNVVNAYNPTKMNVIQ